VSVTCAVGKDGHVKWWLTRESGKPPECMAACFHGCNKTEDPPTALRRAYLAIKVDVADGEFLSSRVGYGLLGSESLRLLWRRLESVRVCAREMCVGRKMFICLRSGYYTSGALCRCSVYQRCDACREVGSTRFLVEDYFCGVEKHNDSWFLGVSDAIGDLAETRLPWCSCIGLAERARFIG
jgi:hypothetical protein